MRLFTQPPIWSNKFLMLGQALIISVVLFQCTGKPVDTTDDALLKPVVVTEPVRFDTDDPAIWVNFADPENSLILGTDKKEEGALYVFDLQGRIQGDLTITDLKRPNNVDVEYGFLLGGNRYDIAVVTERLTHKLRIFSIPDMRPLDNGGIEVFENETGFEYRDLMGIGLYKNHETEKIYAIVGRKNGPTDGTYLWQYELQDNGAGAVALSLVRKFGAYSGQKEIEAIAVDDALGYVYYSDEGVGVRKYHALPEKGNDELALFANTGFSQDHEGISIYQLSPTTGYILISDQSANQFHIYTREGDGTNPHNHLHIKTVKMSTNHSDGSDITSVPLNDQFRHGMFVAMSTDRTFQYYRWEDIAGDDLMMAAPVLAAGSKNED